MKYWDTEHWFAFIFCVVVGTVLTPTVSEIVFRETQTIRGEVIEKSYTPSTSQTTAVPVVGSNGGVGVGVATSGKPESCYFIVRREDGIFVKVKTNINGLYSKSVGDQIEFENSKGALFGWFEKDRY